MCGPRGHAVLTPIFDMALVWLLTAVVCVAGLHAAADDPPPPPPPVTSKVTPGWASNGPRWELYSGEGDLPEGALVGGYELFYGQVRPHYVGRATHKGGVTPITVANYRKGDEDFWMGYGPWNPEAGPLHELHHFEVACIDKEKVRWVPAQNGRVPDGAVVAGIEDGEDVFVCRAFDDIPNPNYPPHTMMMTPGVLRPALGVCGVQFYGLHNFSTYEVLVAVTDNSVKNVV